MKSSSQLWQPAARKTSRTVETRSSSKPALWQVSSWIMHLNGSACSEHLTSRARLLTWNPPR
eukprot:1918661-Amphidinium_carterae.1